MKKQKKRKEAQTLQKKLEGAGVVRKPKTADKGPKPSVLAKAWAWVRVPVIKFAILYVVWLVVGILYGAWWSKQSPAAHWARVCMRACVYPAPDRRVWAWARMGMGMGEGRGR